MARTLEFFFDLTSPYSYLASTQLDALAARTGAEIRWRPFLLGAVFKATHNASPMLVPAKAAYLMQDLESWRLHYQLPPFVLPETFPTNSLQANRLCLVAEALGQGKAFAQRAFHAAFAQGQDLGSEAVLAELATPLGLPWPEVQTRMASQAVKDALRANSEEAVGRGAFGAPTFFVGETMFVGNDRLHFVERALGAG